MLGPGAHDTQPSGWDAEGPIMSLKRKRKRKILVYITRYVWTVRFKCNPVFPNREASPTAEIRRGPTVRGFAQKRKST